MGIMFGILLLYFILGVSAKQVDSVLCSLGECHTETNGCMNSTYGVLCEECNNNGFLQQRTPTIGSPETNICVCYDPSFDPTDEVPCTSLLVQTLSLEVNVHRDRVLCDPHQHEKLGFFKNSGNVQDHVYGQDNPPVPNACLRDIFGPEPKQLIESFRRPLQTCNTYCGPDPNEEFGPNQETNCDTCAHHGDWDPDLYRCECHPKWTLRDSGKEGKDAGVNAYLCNKCQVLW